MCTSAFWIKDAGPSAGFATVKNANSAWLPLPARRKGGLSAGLKAGWRRASHFGQASATAGLFG